MNQGIRYYSPNPQINLQYNYSNQYQLIPQRRDQIQIESEKKDRIISYDKQFIYQERKILSNQNDYQQRVEDFSYQNNHQQKRDDIYIGNDFQQSREVIRNNNHFQQEQDQLNLKEQSSINIEVQENVNAQEIIISNTYLLAVIEFIIASILITICGDFETSLQNFIIKESNGFHLSYPCLICLFISLFIMIFILQIPYRYDMQTSSYKINLAALISYSLTFQQTVAYYYVVKLIKLQNSYIYIQSSFTLIVLILLIIKFRPQYFNNKKKYYSIIMCSTFLFVLFMSVVFKNANFWWMFGLPIILYLSIFQLITTFILFCYTEKQKYNYSSTCSIHIMTFILFYGIILVSMIPFLKIQK